MKLEQKFLRALQRKDPSAIRFLQCATVRGATNAVDAAIADLRGRAGQFHAGSTNDDADQGDNSALEYGRLLLEGLDDA